MNSLPWTPRPVTIALAQFGMSNNPEQNLQQAIDLIEKAAARKADLVCLPELFRSPYFCTHEKAFYEMNSFAPGDIGFKVFDLGHSEHSRDTWRFFESRRPSQYVALTDERAVEGET